ncbi:MAG: hypothetical protein GVY11_02715 [Gammaproteobacteria bacterium]|jgi:hypothetical protein|nr:hypothetical protein [Gammaproteobacteria bacterium]
MHLPSLGRKVVGAGRANNKGRTFTSHILRERPVDVLGFTHVAAVDFGMPLVDLSALSPELDVESVKDLLTVTGTPDP